MDLDPAALCMMRAIADCGTISAAAAKMRTSQPALSQAIRRMEDRLGTALLERQGRGVRLTEAGWVLANHGATISTALGNASDELESLTGLQSGRVRLTAFPSVSGDLVPRALARLHNTYPGMALEFTEAEPPESVQSVRDGQHDLALSFAFHSPVGHVDDPHDHRGLHITDLLIDPMWLVTPAGYTVAGQPTSSLDLAALRDATWIAGCPTCRQHLLRACAVHDFTPRIAFATDDYAAMMGMVSAGLGVALVPSVFLETRDYPHVDASLCAPALTRHIQLVTTTDLARVPAIKAALGAIADVAADIAAHATHGLRTPEAPSPTGH